MVTTGTKTRLPEIAFGEIVGFSYKTFRADKVRLSLTALGIGIGTASLILAGALVFRDDDLSHLTGDTSHIPTLSCSFIGTSRARCTAELCLHAEVDDGYMDLVRRNPSTIS